MELLAAAIKLVRVIGEVWWQSGDYACWFSRQTACRKMHTLAPLRDVRTFFTLDFSLLSEFFFPLRHDKRSPTAALRSLSLHLFSDILLFSHFYTPVVSCMFTSMKYVSVVFFFPVLFVSLSCSTSLPLLLRLA